MTWNENDRQSIELGMKTIVYSISTESEEIVQGLFAGIVERSRFDADEIRRIQGTESTFLGESAPIYPKQLPSNEMVRELHVRLRALYNPTGGDSDEFFAVLRWHGDVCHCREDWLHDKE